MAVRVTAYTPTTLGQILREHTVAQGWATEFTGHQHSCSAVGGGVSGEVAVDNCGAAVLADVHSAAVYVITCSVGISAGDGEHVENCWWPTQAAGNDVETIISPAGVT